MFFTDDKDSASSRNMLLHIWFFITTVIGIVDGSNEVATKFAPLPKGTPYKLLPVDNKGSNGLFKIASGIANVLREEPPYDMINNVLLSKSRLITTQQILDYEAPMIGLASLALISAITIPIVGMILCGCRYAGKCGGNLENIKDIDIRPTKKRKRYTLALVLCCVFLLTGSIIILVSSAKMTNSLPKARQTVNNVFDDIVIYKNNTFKEFNHILGSEVLQVLLDIIGEVIKLGQDIVNPVLQKGTPIINELVISIDKVSKAVTTSHQLLEDIDSNVNLLVSEGKEISQRLTEAQKNISDAKMACSSCELPPGSDLKGDANFTQVPNIADTKSKVQDVVKSNLTQEAEKGKTNFNNLPNTVQNLAKNFTSDIKNYSQDVHNVKTDILRPWEDKLDETLRKTILPYKDSINKYLMPDGDLTRFDNYRKTAYIVTTTLVLIVVFLTLLGLILGMVGASTFDTPSTRGDLSDFGGRILIVSAGFSVFTAIFINIVVAVFFVIGTNTAIICRSASDLDLLRNTVDSPEVMDVFSLSKLIFRGKNESDVLKFTSLLTDCEKSKALWTALHMDSTFFNLTSTLNYRNKLPNFDAVFKDINNTLSTTSVITSKAKQNVNDSLNAGVQDINYTEYTVQTNKPIVQVSLTEFADNITKAANNSTNLAVKSKLQATADSLVSLDNNTVQPSKLKSKKVEEAVKQLINKADDIVSGVEEVGINLNRITKFLITDALSLARQGVQKHSSVIFDDIDQLVTHVMSQVRNDVGKCQPVHNMYQSLTSAVCRDYFGSLNVSWIGYGLCSLFTLITIILCVRASKHFRRVHITDNMKDSDKWDDKVEMPWDAGFELKDQLI